MLQTQYNIVAVLPQYNISTVQEKNTCVSLTNGWKWYRVWCVFIIITVVTVIWDTSVTVEFGGPFLLLFVICPIAIAY